jgi:DNA-binding MarR family transcriptional regulator
MNDELLLRKIEDMNMMMLQFARHHLMKAISDEPSFSRQQIFLLITLLQHERLTISELASELNLSKSATTLAVDRLVRGGYIERTRNEEGEDRRVVWIRATDKARETMRELKAKQQEIAMTFLKKLTPEEIDQLMALYRKMLT